MTTDIDAAVMQDSAHHKQKLSGKITFWSNQDAVNGAASSVAKSARRGAYQIKSAFNGDNAAINAARMAEAAEVAGVDVDLSNLSTAQRIALTRHYAPVSRWQATKAYAQTAASTVANNVAVLAAYVKANPAQAVKKTVAAAGWVAAAGVTAYALYKGAKAVYAWATAKPAPKAVSRTSNSSKKLVVVPGRRPMVSLKKAAPQKVAFKLINQL